MAEIDARKLLFFERLCLMDPQYLIKQLFTLRQLPTLFFLSNLTPTQQGFIPDILSILHRYYLKHYFDEIIIDLAIQWLIPFQSFLEKSKTNCQQLFLFTAL